MTKDERIAELEARIAQLERALGDEGRMLDEAARNAEDLVNELERVARAGETPIETLRRVLAEPTDEELCAEFDAFVESKGWSRKTVDIGTLSFYADGARRAGRKVLDKREGRR